MPALLQYPVSRMFSVLTNLSHSFVTWHLLTLYKSGIPRKRYSRNSIQYVFSRPWIWAHHRQKRVQLRTRRPDLRGLDHKIEAIVPKAQGKIPQHQKLESRPQRKKRPPPPTSNSKKLFRISAKLTKFWQEKESKKSKERASVATSYT